MNYLSLRMHTGLAVPFGVAATGARAGAAGTTVLNLVTYADMAARGRPASSAPAELARRMADRAGIPLGDGDRASARASGLGALLGLGTGVTVGVLGAVLDRTHRPHGLVLAAVLGLGAMAASDLPLAVSEVSNPLHWRLADWLSDLVPHAAYGLATAWALR